MYVLLKMTLLIKFTNDLHTCRFTDDEVLQLHDLYADYGNNWKTIGQLMKRSGPACRDKWRITYQQFGSYIVQLSL